MRARLHFCHQPWTSLFVRKTGRIQPCCANSSELGNIHDDSIEEAWNSEKMQQIRQHIIDGDYAAAGCARTCRIPGRFQEGDEVYGHWVDLDEQHPGDVNLNNAIEAMQQRQVLINNLPMSFDIQANELCNMNCMMCHQNHDDREHLNSNALAKVLLHDRLILDVRFQGGEVFADKGFFDYLINLRDRLESHQKLTVITNGSLFDEKMIDAMIDGSERIKIIISVDSVFEPTYRKIRVSNQFPRVFRNLQYLGERQKQVGSDESVMWNFMVTRSNLTEVKDALDLAQQIGVTISFAPIIGPYEKENLFDYPELFDQSDLDYMADCVGYAEQLNVAVLGLPQIQASMSEQLIPEKKKQAL